MPSVIDRAVRALRARGVSAYETSDDRVSVPAGGPEGFAVTLEARGARDFVVRCEGWVETFGRAEDAYDCFTFALSDQCRLQIAYRGDTPVEWQLQRRQYGMWAPGRPVGRRFAPVWRRRRVAHRRNLVFLTPGEDAGTSTGAAPERARPEEQ